MHFSALSFEAIYFNHALRYLYPMYKKHISLAQLFSIVYYTLGVQGEERGLFFAFDPAKYKGNLPIQDHFVNLFRKNLWGNIWRKISAPRQTRGNLVTKASSVRLTM